MRGQMFYYVKSGVYYSVNVVFKKLSFALCLQNGPLKYIYELKKKNQQRLLAAEKHKYQQFICSKQEKHQKMGCS